MTDYFDSLVIEPVEPPTELESLQDMFSDYFKSLYGFRPRFGEPADWNSIEWLRAEIAKLDEAAPAIYDFEANTEKMAIEKFEDSVTKTIKAGAKDRATAIRWLREATGDMYCYNSDEHFEYVNGLPYGYLKKNP